MLRAYVSTKTKTIIFTSSNCVATFKRNEKAFEVVGRTSNIALACLLSMTFNDGFKPCKLKQKHRDRLVQILKRNQLNSSLAVQMLRDID